MTSRQFRYLAIFALAIAPCAFAQVAGVSSVGSTAYPNGGLNFVGSLAVNPLQGGLYAGAIDYTQPVDYALYGNTGAASGGIPQLYKVKLNAGGADPTLASTLAVNQATYPNDNHFQSIVIDTRSSDVTQHYAYVTNAAANTILKVQMFPNAGNLDTAPVVTQEITLPNIGSNKPVFNAAIDLTNGYAYFAGANAAVTSSTLDQINLNTGVVTSLTGLPLGAYWRAGYANNKVFLMTNSASGTIERINLGVNGSLAGATFDSVSIPNPSGSVFAVDPTLPYAYVGTYKFGDTATPGKFMKFRTDGAAMASLGSINLPNDAGTPTMQERYLSTGAIDPDSHYIINGTDNSDPASIDKIFAGTGDSLPVRAGSIQLPLAASAGHGLDNMRSIAMDPKQGYAYFGCDSTPVNVVKVQYSQKGSVKGDKITLPANATLSSMNFYASAPAPQTASSSGNIRLALYSDNSGTPGSLVWQSNDIPNNVAAGGGWLSITSGLPTVATAGTYWLAWQCDTTLDVPSYSVGGAATGFVFNQAYGSFPGSMPTSPPAGYESGVTLTSDNWSMYATYSVPEPASATLLLAGCVVGLGRRNRRRARIEPV